LWRSFVHPTPELSYAPYVVTAYPTIKECEAALAVEVALLKGEGWEPHYPHVRTVIAFKVQDGTRTATHLRCLPDGTDPRGPKRK